MKQVKINDFNTGYLEVIKLRVTLRPLGTSTGQKVAWISQSLWNTQEFT